ncbi:MAG: nucleoside triphosphate pyrophosphohydrolase [Chloroflexia bacterium]|nr:nucleoside triphosphate pyrophosphohydrolase [Chloroflexia bacterium]
MHVRYDQLVRDRIPEIIRQEGLRCESEEMEQQEYRERLREKIIEEALEVAAASPDSLVEELGDLYEAIESLMVSYGIEAATVANAQAQKRRERGGFHGRVKLLWVERDEPDEKSGDGI